MLKSNPKMVATLLRRGAGYEGPLVAAVMKATHGQPDAYEVLLALRAALRSDEVARQ